jgi:hypothetical protein
MNISANQLLLNRQMRDKAEYSGEEMIRYLEYVLPFSDDAVTIEAVRKIRKMDYAQWKDFLQDGYVLAIEPRYDSELRIPAWCFAICKVVKGGTV